MIRSQVFFRFTRSCDPEEKPGSQYYLWTHCSTSNMYIDPPDAKERWLEHMEMKELLDDR